jgi:CRP-like cAMP-binding protein
MSQPKLLDTLRANRFFEGMHEQELSELASIAQLEQHPKETVIFKEGGPSNKFFVVIEGSVGLEITIEGRAKRIHSVGACELLGWSPILGSKSMKATARTLATTTLISFDTLQCQALTERAPHLAAALLRRVGRAMDDRLHATRLQMLQLCHHHFPDVVPIGQSEGAD